MRACVLLCVFLLSACVRMCSCVYVCEFCLYLYVSVFASVHFVPLCVIMCFCSCLFVYFCV